MQPPPPAVDRPFDVLGIGATSVDFVYQLPAYPSPTASLAKMRISQHFVSCGGQVATALATFLIAVFFVFSCLRVLRVD